MNIYITSINLDVYETIAYESTGISYCRGRNEINYIAVSDYNKINGEFYTHENIDNKTINEIKEMVKDDIKKEFKDFIGGNNE